MRSSLVALVVVLVAAVLVMAMAYADVVIFRDGSYDDGKIKSATAEAITIETPYGDVSYPRNTFYVFYQDDPAHPGQQYYQAGLAMLQLRKKTQAEQLFKKAVAADRRYAQPCQNALDAYEPSLGAGTSVTEAPGMRKFILKCTLCGGTGRVVGTFGNASSTSGATGWSQTSHSVGGSSRGSSRSSGNSSTGLGTQAVMRGCPACGGKGYRIMYLRKDEGFCPACGGAGSVKGASGGSSGSSSRSTTFGVTGSSSSSHSGSSSSSSGTLSGGTSLSAVQYPPCTVCGGRGIRPLASGGTFEGFEIISPDGTPLNGNPGESGMEPGGNRNPGGGDPGAEEDQGNGDKEEAEPEDDRGFFAKYKTYLLIAAAAILVIALFAMKGKK